MTMEHRKLAQDLAKKRELAQKQVRVQEHAKKSSTGDLKNVLTGQLTQRKEERKELLEQLAREEAHRRKVAVAIILAVVAVALIAGGGWWLSSAKARQEKTALAEQKRQEVLVVERFIKSAMQDYDRSGPDCLRRYWDPQVPELVRSGGDARIKAIEKPAGVLVQETLPGNQPEIYEATCREDNGQVFLVQVRCRDGSCQIVRIE